RRDEREAVAGLERPTLPELADTARGEGVLDARLDGGGLFVHLLREGARREARRVRRHLEHLRRGPRPSGSIFFGMLSILSDTHSSGIKPGPIQWRWQLRPPRLQHTPTTPFGSRLRTPSAQAPSR